MNENIGRHLYVLEACSLEIFIHVHWTTRGVLCALYAEYMTPALNTGMWVIDASLKGGPKYTQKGSGAHYRGLVGGFQGLQSQGLRLHFLVKWLALAPS